ncbi:regulatory protein MarR [Cellulomonas fimi ATCC 484]|uniref:Regulatory protein MarR n=2 Tax=Cellulomonas fimi TaxID=1708 RepID=F4H6B3_CELFA|nr:regulatory protein MarR [Cellulomonas fimi ATCC 484]VEH26336.1 transcriptional regulator SlyA [Cellulomonas fimi]
METTQVQLDTSIGYVLKRAAAALRASMDVALRPLSLSVPQYSCLELLGQRPGLSAAELARGAFVTRQSMHAVLHGLEQRGLLARPATARRGRAMPSELTPAGRELLTAASRVVAEVERTMVASLPPGDQRHLWSTLAACADALASAPRPD